MSLKPALLQHCISLAKDKVSALEAALASTRESVSSEGKSTAGDKHETGRAMVHLEQEKLHGQLAEAQTLLTELEKIDATAVHTKVGLGSLVETDKGTFFLATALGKVTFKDESCFVVSIKAPIAKQFIGKTVGEHAHVNAVVYTIHAVH